MANSCGVARQISFLAMAGLAVAVALAALSYILGDPRDFEPIFRAKYVAHLGLVRTHGACAAALLCLGPVQFVSGLPRRIHRVSGRVYLLLVAVAGACGLALGTMAEGGWGSRAGFCLMAGLWYFTGWQALAAIRRHQVRLHRVWMIRNYALTYGAVVLRVYLYGMQHLGYAFGPLYAPAVWVCWVPCLVAAEVVVSRTEGSEG